MERGTITISEAAVYLGLSRTTMYSLAREKRVPVIRLGRRLLVPKIALERMLEAKSEAAED